MPDTTTALRKAKTNKKSTQLKKGETPFPHIPPKYQKNFMNTMHMKKQQKSTDPNTQIIMHP